MSSVIQRVLVFPSCSAAILAASHSLSVTRRVRFSAFSSFRDRPAPGRWPPHLCTLSIFYQLVFFSNIKYGDVITLLNKKFWFDFIPIWVVIALSKFKFNWKPFIDGFNQLEHDKPRTVIKSLSDICSSISSIKDLVIFIIIEKRSFIIEKR